MRFNNVDECTTCLEGNVASKAVPNPFLCTLYLNKICLNKPFAEHCDMCPNHIVLFSFFIFPFCTVFHEQTSVMSAFLFNFLSSPSVLNEQERRDEESHFA